MCLSTLRRIDLRCEVRQTTDEGAGECGLDTTHISTHYISRSLSLSPPLCEHTWRNATARAIRRAYLSLFVVVVVVVVVVVEAMFSFST